MKLMYISFALVIIYFTFIPFSTSHFLALDPCFKLAYFEANWEKKFFDSGYAALEEAVSMKIKIHLIFYLTFNISLISIKTIAPIPLQYQLLHKV